MTTPTRPRRSASNNPIIMNGPTVPGRSLGPSNDNETQPLMNTQFAQSNDYTSTNNSTLYRRARSASEISMQSIKDEIVKFSKRRFWWFCGFGVIAIIIFHLTFLPRTSLSRDYRRWHDIRLTKTDVKRNYLLYSGDNKFETFTNEQYIGWTLGNLSSINGEHSVNLNDETNDRLGTYIEAHFKKYGLTTEVDEYGSNLTLPIDTFIEVFDDNGVAYSQEIKEGEIPGYYGFGKNADVEGDFMLVQNGSEKDYERLIEDGFDVADKIVVINSTFPCERTIVEKALIGERFGVKGIVHYYDIPNKKAIIRDTLSYNYGNLSTVGIPVIPVDVKTVTPILNSIGVNKVSPDSATLKLRFKSRFTTKATTAKNIIGSLSGIIKDGDIIIGASRDSFTASNPSSNNVIMLEILRHYSKLIKLGWKPLRNLKFISFDQSKNGLVGSQEFLNNYSRNVVAFINLDDDIITGDILKVSSNPLLNHLIKRVTKLIPVPDSFFDENDHLVGNDVDETGDDDDDGDEGDNEGKTLFKYWKIQDNHTFDNELGKSLANSDSLIFQYHRNTPVLNMKFTGSPDYFPNSAYHDRKWVGKIDPHFELHRTLTRFLGLFIISLSEHEVINFRTHQYCNVVNKKFEKYLLDNEDTLKSWESKKLEDFDDFGKFVNEFKKLSQTLLSQSITFDKYNKEVQEGLIQDYPWFQAFKKLKVWAQFKVTNYKLLNLDKYLKKEGWFSHLLYNLPHINDEIDDSLLYDVIHSTKQGDFEKTVHHLVKIYHVYENLVKKMS
ncbi:vacuolar protein sorting-associated protein 70 [[Candida] jaroonii]|uniref:Vacuolar protein sorting-associated protein 70 n=1 Tax=[Candida] jaroonii TaxID=467808 RepID=A0ACA9YFG8_9ASCO|nr:vacuolar protein sorting-associated protein 70 [[Candida] jaroonii]